MFVSNLLASEGKKDAERRELSEWPDLCGLRYEARELSDWIDSLKRNATMFRKIHAAYPTNSAMPKINFPGVKVYNSNGKLHAYNRATKTCLESYAKEITDEETLRGFPLSQRERDALDECLGRGARLPRGAGGLTRDNLIRRDWLRYIGIDEHYVPNYVTMPEGMLAIELDDNAINRGLKRPLPATSMMRTGSYKNLSERLQKTRERLTNELFVNGRHAALSEG